MLRLINKLSILDMIIFNIVYHTAAVEKRVLTYLSKHLNIKEMLKLQEELGLPISFQAEDHEDVPESVYQTIKTWKHDANVDATYKKLNIALTNIYRTDLQGMIGYVRLLY